jgi:RNA polymerase sigma-70 factor (ECF subfamily)
VTAALATLPDRYEAVLRMKYLDRMSVADMAAANGETEKAVESLLSRARAAFREAYGDD